MNDEEGVNILKLKPPYCYVVNFLMSRVEGNADSHRFTDSKYNEVPSDEVLFFEFNLYFGNTEKRQRRRTTNQTFTLPTSTSSVKPDVPLHFLPFVYVGSAFLSSVDPETTIEW